ncbi:MAG: hypothetical protein IJT26_02320 [Bacteroidales bacterium]|nr:hypothetical protein [Bacteroidales bacterium]
MKEIMDNYLPPKNSHPLSFGDKERLCELHFFECQQQFGEFWHICTPGNLCEVLFTKPEDYRFGISNMAISSAEAGLTIFTDAIMSNHIHGLAAGTKQQCFKMVESYSYRLCKYFESKGRYVSLRDFRCDEPILIDNLSSMRNEIVYINRNGFVINPAYTPFSYPWGSGYLYFNPLAKEPRAIPYENASFKEKRRLSRRRVCQMPERYLYYNGIILPESYARIDLGERMFRDAHHYMYMLTRNVEAYSEEAKRLGDAIVLTDDELFQSARLLSEKNYGINQPALLPPDSKIEIAKLMNRDYRATPRQIRRIFKIPEETIKQLFPDK